MLDEELILPGDSCGCGEDDCDCDQEKCECEDGECTCGASPCGHGDGQEEKAGSDDDYN